MSDTSREAVEYWARHHPDPRVLEVTNALNALLAERDAAFQAGYAAGFDRGQCHGAETMRERAADAVNAMASAAIDATSITQHPTDFAASRTQTKAFFAARDAIRALPPV
jgi:hypothetical protein